MQFLLDTGQLQSRGTLCVCVRGSVVSDSAIPWAEPARDLCPWDSPGKSKGGWSRVPSLLQGIFPTQGSNLGLLHCRQIELRIMLDPVASRAGLTGL